MAAKTKKYGRVEFEDKGFKVVPLMRNGKPFGQYGIIAGKALVSDPMPLHKAIDTLKSGEFKPKAKDKKFNF